MFCEEDAIPTRTLLIRVYAEVVVMSYPSFNVIYCPCLPTDLPDSGGPQIEGTRPRYGIGDTVRINCTSSRSRPAAKLAWFINADPVSQMLVHIPFSLFSLSLSPHLHLLHISLSFSRRSHLLCTTGCADDEYLIISLSYVLTYSRVASVQATRPHTTTARGSLWPKIGAISSLLSFSHSSAIPEGRKKEGLADLWGRFIRYEIRS